MSSDITYNVQYDPEQKCMVVITATPVKLVDTPPDSHANFRGFAEPVRTGQQPAMAIPNPEPGESGMDMVRSGWQTKAIFATTPPHYTALRLDMLGIMADYMVAVGSGRIPRGTELLSIRPLCPGNDMTQDCDQATVHGGAMCWRCGLRLPEIPEVVGV